MAITSSHERVVNEDQRGAQPHQRLDPARTQRIANMLRVERGTGEGIEELADNADDEARARTLLLRAGAKLRPQGRPKREVVGA